MDFFDLFIIYLACGAPFGVYYFLSHRSNQNHVFFRTILISFFWIPFAYTLFQGYVTKKLPNSSWSKKEIVRNEEVLRTKKDLENIFVKNKSGIPIFELREIFDRYVGLTESALNQDDLSEANSEFFEITGNENISLAAKCYHRRNRKLLFFHHTLAVEDFLNTISKFASSFPNDEEIEKISLKLIRLLNDEPTEKSLKQLFKGKKQSSEKTYVQKPENELWINDLQSQPTANALQISVNSAGATTLNSSIKD